MVQTEKYKKEILSLIEKARLLNSFLGKYEAHYLNDKAQFTILLNNGSLVIDIEVLRDYEKNPNMIFPLKLKRDIEFYACSDSLYQRTKSSLSKWNGLFGKENEL